MTAYRFEDLLTQAPLFPGTNIVRLEGTDTVTFSGGSANLASVVYGSAPNGMATASITFGGHSVVLDPGIQTVAANHNLQFGDGSQLLIGGPRGDSLEAPQNSAAFGGDGADTLAGQGGHDVLQGNAGNDILTAQGNANTIYGGQGDDMIVLSHGDRDALGSFAQGNKGDDTLVGGGGFDLLLGGQGNDHIEGRGTLEGNLGNDVIVGAGESVVSGEDGSILVGDEGNDTLVATGPNCMLIGGADADRFVFTFSEHDHVTARLTQIADWTAGDTISIAGLRAGFSYQEITDPAAGSEFPDALTASNALMHAGTDVVAVQVGLDVVIFFQTGDGPDADLAVRLTGRLLTDIGAQDIATGGLFT